MMVNFVVQSTVVIIFWIICSTKADGQKEAIKYVEPIFHGELNTYKCNNNYDCGYDESCEKICFWEFYTNHFVGCKVGCVKKDVYKVQLNLYHTSSYEVHPSYPAPSYPAPPVYPLPQPYVVPSYPSPSYPAPAYPAANLVSYAEPAHPSPSYPAPVPVYSYLAEPAPVYQPPPAPIPTCICGYNEECGYDGYCKCKPGYKSHPEETHKCVAEETACRTEYDCKHPNKKCCTETECNAYGSCSYVVKCKPYCSRKSQTSLSILKLL